MSPAIVLFLMRILIALALYGFLGAVLLFLWRDLQPSREVGRPIYRSQLRVVEGDQVGLTFVLENGNRIGRAADNTVCLRDETVSAYHAQIIRQGEHWLIEDLDSRNGTWLNQMPVREPVIITNGDTIGLGRVTLQMEPMLTEPHSAKDVS